LINLDYVNQYEKNPRHFTSPPREASAELAILRPPTLYAYVSRGLIRSEPLVGFRESHRYRAEDVRGPEGTARAVAGAARPSEVSTPICR